MTFKKWLIIILSLVVIVAGNWLWKNPWVFEKRIAVEDYEEALINTYWIELVNGKQKVNSYWIMGDDTLCEDCFAIRSHKVENVMEIHHIISQNKNVQTSQIGRWEIDGNIITYSGGQKSNGTFFRTKYKILFLSEKSLRIYPIFTANGADVSHFQRYYR